MRLSITLFWWLACGKVWECPSLAKFCSNNFVRQQSLYLDPINSYWDILWVRQISEKPWETYMSFCLLQALDGPLLHGNMITCASFSVFLLILICKGPNMSIAVLLNTGRPAAMFSLRIWLIIWLSNFLQVRHLPVTCLAIFCTPTIRNACLIHRWDFCNCIVLAFRKGFSRVLINDLGRIMGLCISSGNDPMFSSLPYAHKTPCLSDAGISFLSTVYTLIVC